MNTALILFRNVANDCGAESLNGILSAFYSGGIKIDTVEMLSFSDDLGFKRRLEEFRNTADNLIVCFSKKVTFDLKQIIADNFETSLVENENAKKFLDAVSSDNGVAYSRSFALMPIEATLLPNIRGAFQGFMIEDKEFSLVVLPEEPEQLKVMCDGYVVPYFETKYGVKPKKITLKYFGEHDLLLGTLKDAEENFDKCFTYFLKTTNGDTTVTIFFNEGVEKSHADATVRYVVGKLQEFIYAEFDTSLQERLFDLLRIRKLRLSTAESFTGGRVISSVISNAGASESVMEGVVCYSNQSKMNRLGVKQSDLNTVGAVSAQVAGQMALGLLVTGECDVAIATTGLAGPKNDDTDKPVGLCYIAIGMKDGVHSYKYRFTGDREEITETAKNTALFLAISRLKKI